MASHNLYGASGGRGSAPPPSPSCRWGNSFLYVFSNKSIVFPFLSTNFIWLDVSPFFT